MLNYVKVHSDRKLDVFIFVFAFGVPNCDPLTGRKFSFWHFLWTAASSPVHAAIGRREGPEGGRRLHQRWRHGPELRSHQVPMAVYPSGPSASAMNLVKLMSSS